MGFLEAVGGFFTGVGNSIAGVASSAWGAVKAVFHFFLRLGDLVGGAWDWMVNGIEWLGDRVWHALVTVGDYLVWTITTAIPEAAKWAFGKAWGLARAGIHFAEHAAAVALHAVTRFLTGLIHTLRSWAEHAFHFVLRIASDAWRWVERAGKWVYNLVSHPARLADWLAGAIVLPILRFLISFGAPVIVWLIKRATSILPAIVHLLEDALARVV